MGSWTEIVTRAVHGELRKRLGGPFTLDELADLYDEGTGWCTDLAVEVAPDEPFAWDARIVADAAFGRYMRAATDFAGGRHQRRLSKIAAIENELGLSDWVERVKSGEGTEPTTGSRAHS